MLIFIYDGSFIGLLTSIFEGYNQRRFPDLIQAADKQSQQLFADVVKITSDSTRANRVWKGIQQKLSSRNKQLLYYAYLSEAGDIEMRILRFTRRLFEEGSSIETDFGDTDVIEVVNYARKVKKEAMRIRQFVRFQQAKDGLYFCGIEPVYDVLPLVLEHFRSRFADQQWLLYDLRRNYGAYFNKKSVEEVELCTTEISRQSGKLSENVINESDGLYQTLWQSYFKSINIEERKNLRLQRQHMPRRFWKYLTEKQ